MRDLARRLRRDAVDTCDSWYRCQMQNAALDLETEADRLDRAPAAPDLRRLH